MKLTDFLNRKQLLITTEAIKEAEDRTSGEIKIHIENHCNVDVIERAKEVFFLLQMQNTEERNGVLIYIAFLDKKIAIIGDEGINCITPDDYWENEVNILVQYFKEKKFSDGIISTIHAIGEKLLKYFPIQENDINELSDEISYYNN